MAEEEILDELSEQKDDIAVEQPFYKRSKLITFLSILILVILSILMMVLVSYFVAHRLRAEQYKEVQSIILAPAPKPLAIFMFPKQFRVNTADQDNTHFIQVNLHLGYNGEDTKLVTELTSRQSQMMHIINIILSSKKKSEVLTVNQRLNLAEEIKSHLNLILRNSKIKDIYFTEFIVS